MLKNDQAIGTDGITGELIKYESGLLREGLCSVLMICVKIASVQDDWKNDAMFPCTKRTKVKAQSTEEN